MLGAAPGRGATPGRWPRSPPVFTTGWPGRNGARCAATAIGPMPGPPPPCGMQKVLCRFRWQTSAPMSPRAASGRPARSCSRRPCTPGRRARGRSRRSRGCLLEDAVGRRVGDHQRAERRPRAPRPCARRSARSTLPRASQATRRPGSRPSPRSPGWCRAPRPGSGRRRGAPRRGSRGRRGSTSRPAYSPCEPALGCSDTAAKPVISASQLLEVREELGVALGLRRAARTGAAARTRARSPGSSRAVALSFIVHEPSGIIECVEREVARLEPADVAQHLGLGVVRVEDRVRRGTRSCARTARAAPASTPLGQRPRRGTPTAPPAKTSQQRLRPRAAASSRRARCRASRRRSARRLMPALARALEDRRGAAPASTSHAQRVEEGRVAERRARAAAGPRRSTARERVHARGDAPQALGPVVDRVHAGHHRQQHLRGADVARRLLAADVLLARLQRHAVARCWPSRVLRDADEAAGHLALVLVARGEERRVRAAEAQRHAEALRDADARCRRPTRRAA